MISKGKTTIPFNVCTKLLLIICHSCASPTCGEIIKCCFDGAITMERITPVPVTVIVRIWDGNGTGNHPVSGTSNGAAVYPSHQAVADRTVILSNDVSFSSCSDIGRNHDISCKNAIKSLLISGFENVCLCTPEIFYYAERNVPIFF